MPSPVNDIFISYSHRDNISASGGKGWIDSFHDKLKERLGVLLGRDPVIWRDPRLKGGEYFDDEIKQSLEGSKVLLSVLSPSYLNSNYCAHELRYFSQHAEKDIGVRIGNLTRCIKVVKTFIARETHPPELQGTLGYEMYIIDDVSKRPREFGQDAQGYQYQSYLLKLEDLALDLKDLILAIDGRNQVSQPTKIDRTVYLAETTSDRAQDREKIMRELQSRGYHVLPDMELPHTFADYRNAVRDDLERSRLSVHLIGETYGIIPDGIPDGEKERSIVYLQNELSVERCDDPGFSRIIWVPVGLKPANERQREFIEYLQTDSNAQKGAELLQRPFEELKTRIIEKLTIPKPVAPKPAVSKSGATDDDLVRVYLVCDKLDIAEITPLSDYLFNKKYEVISSITEGNEEQSLEYHKLNLLNCDAILIFYGNGNEFWLRTKLWDLKKVRGWGREQAMLCRAIYLSAPETEYKKRFKTLEALLLPPSYNGFSSDVIDQFIAEIEKARIVTPKTGSGGA